MVAANFLFIRALSSVGQSRRLITVRSWVRVPEGPPLTFFFDEKKKVSKKENIVFNILIKFLLLVFLFKEK